MRKGIRVYACPGFSVEFENKVKQLQGVLIEADRHMGIDRDISVTGEIPGEYKAAPMPEQALMVQTAKGITVITGCSHPGIVKMIQKVKTFFPQKTISLVFGGFHLKDQDRQAVQSVVASMKDMGVEKVGPTHCTGSEAQMLFKNSYGDQYVEISAGKKFEI